MELKPSGDRPRVPRDRLILWFALFFSGAAGMAYEIIWFRSLRVSYGHTLHAMTVVVAVYMAGLAVGSWLIRKRLDRYRDAVLAYGFVEIAIGFAALATPLILDVADQVFISSYAWLRDQYAIRAAVQTALTLPALFLPTILMGATLPLAVRAVGGQAGGHDDAVGLFNGANLAGAAAGAFVTGYLVLPALGKSGAQFMATGLNLLAAFIAMVVWWRRRRRIQGESAPPPISLHTEDPESSTSSAAVLLGATISGACAMGYQMVWGRALIPLVGSSVYAFTTITVTFLAGLALGSHLFIRSGKLSTPRALGTLQVASASTAFLLLPVFNLLPPIVAGWVVGHGDFVSSAFIQFTIVGLVLILPTTIQGMALPCAVACLRKSRGDAAPALARVYAYNTIGSVAGTMLTGFLLLPWLGSRTSLGLWALASVLVGWALLRPRRIALGLGMPLLVTLIVLGTFFFSWDRHYLALNPFLSPDAFVGRQGEADPRDSREILFFEEGRESTVAVLGEAGTRFLTVNGKTDASTGADMPTQKKLAHFPMFFHPFPRDVAVLGLGSGVTLGHVTAYSEVERIDVVELEPAVVKAARWFEPENLGGLDDPRVHMHLDDGLLYFKSTDRSFDVIISEPSNPWMAGIADLFTVETFRTYRSRLKEGGVLCQWLHGYKMSPDDFRTIIRTFLSEFPNTTIWGILGTKDYLLLGWNGEKPAVSAEDLAGHFQRSPRLFEVLGAGESPTTLGMLGDFLLDSDELRSFAGPGELNTEEHPVLEFSAARNIATSREDEIFSDLSAARSRSYPKFLSNLPFPQDVIHMILAEIFLSKGRAAIANFEMAQQKNLLGTPLTRPELIPARCGPSAFATSFERYDATPLVPFLGSTDPGDGTRSKFWRASIDFLELSSSVAVGEAHTGAQSLMLESIPGENLAGYSIPLAVLPEHEYELNFWAKSALGPDSSISIAVLDWQSGIDRKTLENLSATDLSLRALSTSSLPGPFPWKENRLVFRAGPQTNAVLIAIFRIGMPDHRAAAVDDVKITCANR
jgi:spermidine synthase